MNNMEQKIREASQLLRENFYKALSIPDEDIPGCCSFVELMKIAIDEGIKYPNKYKGSLPSE